MPSWPRSDRLLVLHNAGAENFTLGIGGLELTALADLETVIAASDDVRLTDIDVSATTLAVNLRENGLAQVRVLPLTDVGIGAGNNIAFDEELFEAVAVRLLRLAAAVRAAQLRVVGHTRTPSTTSTPRRRSCTCASGSRCSAATTPLTTSRRVNGPQQATEHAIPVSVVRHKSVADHSEAPTLLYGYGSYEISYDSFMSIARLSLLDRGMVFALAHIRGGGEMGRQWYEQGKLLRKKNTFTDYIDVAHHLIDQRWTTRGRLVGLGGSAGGLLMGAVANMAPELFAGIVAQVPFVDALTTILDPTLPLTVIEWDEWGDPLHDPEVYAYMKSYTPYENIAAARYPRIYALTSINDTRVFYVEPAKWVAQLRDTLPDHSQVIFKCEMSAGHGGASGRYDAWRETADYYAWIVDVSGARHEAVRST
ncbi:MAG: prolyl oligopeptidase family serine peptidase [Nocardioidaceae bacterium]